MKLDYTKIDDRFDVIQDWEVLEYDYDKEELVSELDALENEVIDYLQAIVPELTDDMTFQSIFGRMMGKARGFEVSYGKMKRLIIDLAEEPEAFALEPH